MFDLFAKWPVFTRVAACAVALDLVHALQQAIVTVQYADAMELRYTLPSDRSKLRQDHFRRFRRLDAPTCACLCEGSYGTGEVAVQTRRPLSG